MYLRIVLGILFSFSTSLVVEAQNVVDFHRDVQPILEFRCLECHGPEKAKNDFRVDSEESLGSYIEPGDFENSYLWTDYLVTEDEDMKMPPVNSRHSDGMTAAELATIKLWIEEGADFDWQNDSTEEGATEANMPVADMSTSYKALIFQGLFHPATVHFPIGLLSISMVFLVLSKIFGKSFESAAFHCLWVGALGAVGACLTGWGYALHEGYGVGYSAEAAIDRHRWLGIIVAAGALCLIPLAYAAYKKESSGAKVGWLLGAIVLGMAVSLVGYQGGELTFGEDHYEKEFDKLFVDDQPKMTEEVKAEQANTPEATGETAKAEETAS
ncbi:c-type cytochrome domain-containing protein [Bremerella cremea]|uniref:c-type cytochrome domain-containing protein n=1 Tax=Bremerella cremea TaxID=1031537 RepID=UPI0031EED740